MNDIKDEEGNLYGYARVSTADQDMSLQLDALQKAGVDFSRIFTDKKSGRTMNRAGLQRITKTMREGDTLLVWRLDRLGRNARHLLEMIETLEDEGIEFRSLQEGIDTSTSGGKLLLTMLAALAQFESDLIGERTKAGMAASKARGVKSGRHNYVLSSEKRMIKFTEMWIDGDIPDGGIGARNFIRIMNEADPKAQPFKSATSYTNWKNRGFAGLHDAWTEVAKKNDKLGKLAKRALAMQKK